jgi:bifunctional DNase/RNase
LAVPTIRPLVTLTLGGVLCFLLSSPALLSAAEEPGVQVQEVKVALVDTSLIVLLIVDDRFVPIHVDATVAGSIHSVLSGSPTVRPLSHDLMRLILLELGAKVTRVVVTLKEKTYYADVTITMGDRTWVFDSRSSDAIALALLFKAPIIVAKPTWDSASQNWESPPGQTS